MMLRSMLAETHIVMESAVTKAMILSFGVTSLHWTSLASLRSSKMICEISFDLNPWYQIATNLITTYTTGRSIIIIQDDPN
jgi:hypothetical protein